MKYRLLKYGLGLIAGVVLSVSAGGAMAMSDHAMAGEPTSGFRQIEQPLPVKIAVTAAGLGLIGLELWWFLLSKTQTRRAQLAGGLQEITITVDGGYTPDQIELEAGKPIRLNFLRQDPSSCLETVILPHFRRSIDLPLERTTTVDLPAPTPGEYLFHCGMNMYRGTLTVR